LEIQAFSESINHLEQQFLNNLKLIFAKIFKVKNQIRTIENKKRLTQEKMRALEQM